ncbi:PAS domain S-box protein [Methylobacterium sp. sgz302541]|uniref:PAS domain S-box protein n=1 Tax=unclassified Methylobacterium TaxID=2615210 RepID=UPI003D34E6A2
MDRRTGDGARTSRAATLRWALLAALLVFASAWGGIAFTRSSERIATIWIANAILLAMLLKTPTRLWPALVLGGGAGNLAANLVTADAPPIAAGLALCNLLEVLLVAVPLRRWLKADLDLSRLEHLTVFVLLAGLVTPAVAGGCAALILEFAKAAPAAAVLAIWYPADALGFLVVTPLALMLRIEDVRHLARSEQRLEIVLWFAALLTVTGFVFLQSRYPLLFLPMATLGLIAARLGSGATALGIGLVAVTAMVATVRGQGPMMLVPGDFASRVLVLQVFVAATVLSKLPLTALLSTRTRLEREVSQVNARLTLAETIAGIGNWRYLPATGEIIWSAGVFHIHGLDPATHVPTLETVVAAYHPDDRDEVARWLRGRDAQQGEHTLALRLVRGDGALRHVSWRGLRERGPDGEVTALFGTITDVTELREAERAARDSEARYRLLADNSTDMITHMDLAGRRLFVSPGARDLLGHEPSELVGTSPLEMIHPDDADGLRRVLGELSGGDIGRAVTVNRLRHADGRWIWVEASLRLLRGEDGRPSGFVASIRNIMDRKRADEARQDSEARYRLLADNTSDLIVLGHADGRRSYISPAVETMLGYGLEEARGIGMRDWIHPEDIATVFATTQGLSAARPAAVATFRLRHKAGHHIWAEAAFRRVEDGSGSTVVSAIRDVTERVEQAERLRQAMVAAESGARIKAEFLANMSHELRTPLTGMLGVHDLIQSDPALSPRQRHFVELAQESGRALLTIVNDILDFSKIEAGQMAIERVPFSFREMAESCRRLGTEAIKLDGVALTTEIDPEVPDLLLGDPTRLRQVLLNLVTNAIKFTGEGTVRIRARYADGHLLMAVSDTGIGIPADALPHLFERFSQADGSTARRFGGTGLGLSISKRLIELMGGSIGVESVPGEGSTFRFRVPLASAERDRRAGPRPAGLAACPVHGRRILVAEDNAINREIILTVLSQKGHRVTLAEDGEAALRAFRRESFDVVLMDVQMPAMDGLAATAAIRAWEREESRDATPIVALTANALAEEVSRCRAAGMDAHVAKPIDWTTLFGTIERLCPSPPEAAAEGPARETAEPPVLDGDALAELVSLLGPNKIAAMLVSFRRDIERRLALLGAAEATEEDLSAHAHAVTSLAGQLGFMELSAVCAGMQAPAGGGLDRIATLRSAADRALDAAAASPYATAA